jgi:hypothetical protein
MEEAALPSCSPQQAKSDLPASDESSQSNKSCAICGILDYTPNNIKYEEHFWDDLVTSARSCTDCDTIVRGCRGWLDGSGRQSLTPWKLALDVEPSVEPSPSSGDSERDDSVHIDGSDDDERISSLGQRWSKRLLNISMLFKSGVWITLSMFRVQG